MALYYLSDLHLGPGASDAGPRLARFLYEVPRPGDVLVLGGDIFDLFVGNKEVFRREHETVLEAIRHRAREGVTVHYLEGNHDFHLGRVFAKDEQVHVHADAFTLEWDGLRVFVAHGDLIDPTDRGYRFLRAVTRHFLFRLLLCFVPGAWLAAFGKQSSHHSRRYNHTDAGGETGRARLRELYLDYARAQVAGGADFVLLGHSHLADQTRVREGGREGEYLNLGFAGESLVYGRLGEGAPSFRVLNYF